MGLAREALAIAQLEQMCDEWKTRLEETVVRLETIHELGDVVVTLVPSSGYSKARSQAEKRMRNSEGKAKKYAAEAAKLQSEGKYRESVKMYRRAISPLFNLVRLYPDSNQSKKYIEDVMTLQALIKEIQPSKALTEPAEVERISLKIPRNERLSSWIREQPDNKLREVYERSRADPLNKLLTVCVMIARRKGERDAELQLGEMPNMGHSLEALRTALNRRSRTLDDRFTIHIPDRFRLSKASQEEE